MNDMTAAYVEDGVLVVPWRIDPAGRRYGHDGEIIELQTPEMFASLLDGTTLISIFGEEKVKGRDEIDQDTRFGRIAWGLPDRREAP